MQLRMIHWKRIAPTNVTNTKAVANPENMAMCFNSRCLSRLISLQYAYHVFNATRSTAEVTIKSTLATHQIVLAVEYITLQNRV